MCGFNSLSVHRDHITVGLVFDCNRGSLGGESDIGTFLMCWTREVKKSAGSSGARARPVLKHGPRRLTCMRVQWGTKNPRGRNESDFFNGKRKRNFFFFPQHHEPVSFKGDCVESMHAKTRKMAIFA